MSWLSLFVTTQSMAATTCDTSTEPSEAPALTSTMCASGAMPAKLRGLSRSLRNSNSEVESWPAMRPAMCVPWPYPSTCDVGPDCESKDTSGPCTTLPASRRPATGVTPVSISATPTPSPVR